MRDNANHDETIRKFIISSEFMSKGSVIVDLDGTALLEERGKVYMSSTVERGITLLVNIHKPVIVNTLRFPLSVSKVVARDWLSIYKMKMPAVLLNGGQFGFFYPSGEEISFEEISAFPMDKREVSAMLYGIEELITNGITEIILFWYERDWKVGEMIWTPHPSHVPALKEKYMSATAVVDWKFEKLRSVLEDTEVIMASVLVDKPKDELMSYQHSDPSKFLNHAGVDKAFGTSEAAKWMGISLPDSIGAGDTVMDSFLNVVGLSVAVGNLNLPYRGLREHINAKDPRDLGDIMQSCVRIVSELKQKNENQS